MQKKTTLKAKLLAGLVVVVAALSLTFAAYVPALAATTQPSSNQVMLVAKPKPTYPPGVTAVCKDGTYSYSQHKRGTCSHHGGVKKWVVKVK